MLTQIFVNLPVKDLEKSKAFFAELGYTFNPQFTDHKAACLVISDTIYVMLITESFFKTFTKKDIVDTTKSSEAIIALTMESRERVNEMVTAAVAAGGATHKDPDDHGWMYAWGFLDPDGHQWEPFYMDVAKAPEAPGK